MVENKLKRSFPRFSSNQGSWSQQCKPGRRRLNGQKGAHGTVKSSVVLQAEELQSKLDPINPSFIKSLLKSHVSGGFWLGLPAPFCQKHLPQEDTFMTLESQDGNGKRYKTNYLARKMGLSGGWKGFAVAQRLLVGDVLVFHLVSATKFKVYAIREKNLTEVDGALCLLKLDNHATSAETNHKAISPPENSVNNSTDSCSNGITNFDNFNLAIDELLKDYYDLPSDIKWKYYELCCSQNTLLHAHLQKKEVNHLLIAGIIIETVNIANALKTCLLSTFRDGFPVWRKILSSFEQVGMNVDFLRARLDRLGSIACEPKVSFHKKEYLLLHCENDIAEGEIRRLRNRLSEMRKVYKQRAADIENLQGKIQSNELKFQQQVSAPW